MIDEWRLSVVFIYLVAVDYHLIVIEIERQAYVVIVFAVAESLDGADGGAGPVFGSAIECGSVAIVARAEEVVVHIAIEQRIHGYDEDVLGRILIVHIEVVGIVFGQLVVGVKQVADFFHGLPGVGLDDLSVAEVVGLEYDLAAVGSLLVYPVVVGIYFGVDGQLHHQEIGHGCGHSAIVFSIGPIAFLVAEIGHGLVEFVVDPEEERLAVGEGHLVRLDAGLCDQWHAPVEVHQIEIEHGAHGA